MSKEITTVITKERQAIFKKMPKALQEVALDFAERLAKGAMGVIIIQYNMGATIGEVLANERAYGSEAAKQLGDYLGLTNGETLLYNLRNFAATFKAEFVKQQSARHMADGQHLSLSHWIALTKVDDPKDQLKWLEEVFRRSLSANALELEIKSGGTSTRNVRQGGRKPQVPTSAIAGLQKMFQQAQQLNRYSEVAVKSVFDKIDDMEPDKVTDVLLERLEKTRETLHDTAEGASGAVERLDENIERVKRVLEEKEEAAKAAEAEEGGEAPRKGAGKASANGKPHGKKKKKKKKRQHAAAAG